MATLVAEMHADHGDPSGATIRNWVANLSTSFSAHGLTNVQQSTYPPRPGLERYWNEIKFLVMEEYSYARLDRNPETKGTGKGMELRKVIQRAYEESLRGVRGVGDMVVAAGRKAWGGRGGRGVDALERTC